MRDMRSDTGFTLVEMLVTVVLIGIFIAFFVQMFRAGAAQQASIVRQAKANNLAYSNLSKFPRASSISPAYVCDTSTNTSTNQNNLTINPNAAGTLILSDASANKEPTDSALPNATQEVRAYSPQGCGSNALVKLISTVTYGFTGQQTDASYATYVQN
ncbi:prepilin-type N-terminal cleavage/methylation domain-containing protein [Candidatus Mycosynbacter amalyticus]|uniref:Prepilin-type N-terminal cleavage/methylation domain-containing protein n=2 Tax=Candidatus Mycosynbacter amalyticus TaxID=2665156 RepID=A0A857MLX3_9BACT|nr:prepilin-type N-terminal cleavage/methylation domain-containing protein [Candidatus Mycosynbacter amalyticus]